LRYLTAFRIGRGIKPSGSDRLAAISMGIPKSCVSPSLHRVNTSELEGKEEEEEEEEDDDEFQD
jgi:hypothetical protein